ncbi:hypothetical protein BJ508DRAFT_329313 [Ascobolus immersus RN42]|uniref:F-box domain-containing protein n=1 Tax=Ascobolus immersus RN42 TaxID=1160509 RepID=A0A3N4I2C0_ASCIM|nr:hypothetical protein BJ508DRAFT_329313 [Ascobolus immersus RN42]
MSYSNPTRNPSPVHQHVAFFRLPLELRLDIYECCSAFTLLQLSHTHPYLRTEINNHPSIYKSAFGYLPRMTAPAAVERYLHPIRHLGKPWKIRNASDLSYSSEEHENFKISMIIAVADEKERYLFNRQFCPSFPYHSDAPDRARCCWKCFRIWLTPNEAVLVDTRPSSYLPVEDDEAGDTSPDTFPTHTTPPTRLQHHLFLLPYEMRLSIYTHCTSYALLNLTQTNTQLRDEVHRNPRIYTSSFGYNPHQFLPSGPFSLKFPYTPRPKHPPSGLPFGLWNVHHL